MSVFTEIATPPSSDILFSSSCSLSSLLAAMATRAPEDAKAAATAAPMPLDAPVTMATRSDRGLLTEITRDIFSIFVHLLLKI